MTKLLILGGTGLVGSYFVKHIQDRNPELELVTLGRSNSQITLDLLSEDDVINTISREKADYVINFAGYTKVDEAQAQSGDKNGEAYLMNVALPKWLARACLDSKKRLIQISTDFVFDGQKTSAYIEEDLANPVDSWYAQTKQMGEEAVINEFGDNKSFCIVRIAYPYSGEFLIKNDLIRVIVNRLKSGQSYAGITDQKITPTSVVEVACGLELLIEKQAEGLFHLAGNYGESNFITPFELASKVAKIFDLDSSLITQTTFAEFSKDRPSPRPQNTWLNTAKIQDLGMEFMDLDQILQITKDNYLSTDS